MKTAWFQKALATGLISIIFLSGCGRIKSIGEKFKSERPQKLVKQELIVQTKAGEAEFDVQIADEPVERAKGYMFRKKISDDEGMWFVFGEDAPIKFWMRNVKFSLDLIFVDKNFVVKEIIPDVPPCEQDPCETYGPTDPVRYVLEIKGGLASEKGIQLGDTVSLRN